MLQTQVSPVGQEFDFFPLTHVSKRPARSRSGGMVIPPRPCSRCCVSKPAFTGATEVFGLLALNSTICVSVIKGLLTEGANLASSEVGWRRWEAEGLSDKLNLRAGRQAPLHGASGQVFRGVGAVT